jgi:sortase (surface protein transpeptidase)
VKVPRKRLLSAAALTVGLLAVGAGVTGLTLSHGQAPDKHLPAKPSTVAAPTAAAPRFTPVPNQTAQAPGGLSGVAQVALPVSLTVPAIGVKTSLIHLGLQANGSLQVPATTAVAGWYTESPRPGAVGSAVIAGHVDSKSGPGVFYWLRNLKAGNKVYVTRADGSVAVFDVTRVDEYQKAAFPTSIVYGATPDAELRLITCGGTFDSTTGHYLSNIIAYATLVS